METAHTHLGNKELHKRHSVMITGGNIPRAKVMDQFMIDRYLMRGLLNMREFLAGEYLLSQATNAGVWAKTPDMSRESLAGAGGGRQGGKSHIPAGWGYGRTLIKLRKKFGVYHAYLVPQVVCFNWDVSGNGERMGILKEGLRYIADTRGVIGDPLQPLRGVVTSLGGGVSRKCQNQECP